MVPPLSPLSPLTDQNSLVSHLGLPEFITRNSTLPSLIPDATENAPPPTAPAAPLPDAHHPDSVAPPHAVGSGHLPLHSELTLADFYPMIPLPPTKHSSGCRVASSVDPCKSSSPCMAPVDYLELIESLPVLDVNTDWLCTDGWDLGSPESRPLPKTPIVGREYYLESGLSSAPAPIIPSIAPTPLSSTSGGQQTWVASLPRDESPPGSPLSDAPVPSFVGIGRRASSRTNTYRPNTPEPLDIANEDWRIDDYDNVPRLSHETYNAIAACFASVNQDNGFYRSFTTKPVPSQDSMNSFIQVYFEVFQSIFPLLHQPTFDPSQCHWLLVLAVAATGCRFSQQSRGATRLMDNLLRRAVQLNIEQNPTTLSSLWLAQSALLSQICMMFSGDSMLTDMAHANTAMVATLCRRANAFVETETGNLSLFEGSWDCWVQAESKRRLAYCAWVLDTQHIMFWELPPVIPSELLQVQMPCDEQLWELPNQYRLLELLDGTRNSAVPCRLRRLGEELSYIYRTKRRPEGLSDFHTLILSMGVFRDANRLENPSAYLDILRQSDSPASQQSQMGRLAIQHNYLMALLLQIRARELFAFSGWRIDDAERAKSCFRLQRWGKERGSEARCAVFHAAKAFSCLRTYPTQGYHKTQCILLSTLMIWAYVDCCAPRNVEPTVDYGANEARAITLRFDKCSLDDSMVEEWLRNGEKVRPYLAGVGSLEERGATTRLIKETVRLLTSDESWPLSYTVRFLLQDHYSSKAECNRRGVAEQYGQQYDEEAIAVENIASEWINLLWSGL
ncbi:fungal-specific transcription factor domain-containing protein [Ilyonectria sp. MPI-CAGE-AT-0026]|nr:fungal-specific transcription factor domain-containing protein [Ilyonectria sp. MPI-CAGE-AT-0026]